MASAELKKSTYSLVLTSDSDCRASKNLDDFQCKLTFSPYVPIFFVMQGKCLFQDISRSQVSIIRYFKVLSVYYKIFQGLKHLL